MQRRLTHVPAGVSAGSAVARPLRVVATAAGRLEGWASSREGRRRTERALRRLPGQGWQVLPDVPLPGLRAVAHVVVGPSGTYVLDSRSWPGVVTVDQKGATVTPGSDVAGAWTASGHHRAFPPAAGEVVRAITTATGARPPAPHAVVVVWAPFPDQVTVSAGVTYVAGEHLVEWLLAQPGPSIPPPVAAQPRRAGPAVTGGLVSTSGPGAAAVPPPRSAGG